jgi:hypothetical protein
MLKSEVLEIKKQFAKDSNVITKICGCYVDSEKEIKLVSKEAFYLLPEDDTFKYEDIFRKTLSGTLGKNLLNIDFPLSAEKEGQAQNFLLKLRDSELEDDELLEEFYKKIVENFEHVGNYYIILVNFNYDIPGKTKDRRDLEDASEEVYHAILCSICPVKLSKAGLKYDEELGKVENAKRSKMIEPPVSGFLFPVFNDRTSDIHSLLYFSKKPESINSDFVREMFEVTPPLPAPEQKQIIQDSLVNALGEDFDYLAATDLHETILNKINENAENPEPLVLDKNDMVKILSESGMSDEAIVAYEKDPENDIAVMAENIIDKKKFELKTSGISIKADSDHIHLIQTKMIGGSKCIVINIEEDIEVNGMKVKG